jgi:hypothetical protein
MSHIEFISQIKAQPMPVWFKPKTYVEKGDIYSAYIAFCEEKNIKTKERLRNQPFWQKVNNMICDPKKNKKIASEKSKGKVRWIKFFRTDEIINNINNWPMKNKKRKRSETKKKSFNKESHKKKREDEEISNDDKAVHNGRPKKKKQKISNEDQNSENISILKVNNNNSFSNKSKNYKNLNIDLDDFSDIDENEVSETDSTSSKRPKPIPLISQQDKIPPINSQNNHQSLLEQEENGVSNQFLNDIDRLLDEIYELSTKSNEVIEGMCKGHLQNIKVFLEGLLVMKNYFNNPFNCYYSNLEQIEILATQIYELSLNLETHKQFDLATCKDRLLAVKEFLEKNINQEAQSAALRAQKGENFELYESMCVDEALRAKLGEPPQSEKLQENQQEQHLHIEEQQENFVNSQNMTNSNEKEWDIKFLDMSSRQSLDDTVNNKQCSKQKKNLNFYIIRYNEKKIQIPRRTLNTLRKLNEKYVEVSLILPFKGTP